MTLKEEKRVRSLGYRNVVGLDEAGRGPLAGPVFAAAVMVRNQKLKMRFPKMADSKTMSAKDRERVFKLLTNNPNIEWGIGQVSEKTIDRINIFEATKLAMQKSLRNLKADFLILDGNFKIHSNLPQEPVIKGDSKVFSCMAAGIIAKVSRDRLMLKYHKKYPLYGFDRHKGYGTKAHFAAIRKQGICDLHRKSFSLLKKN
jgi:ribonuclease HII